jgi:hypothetical protein
VQIICDIFVRQKVLDSTDFWDVMPFLTVNRVSEEPGAIIFRTEENCGNIFRWYVGNGIPNCTAYSPEIHICPRSAR